MIKKETQKKGKVLTSFLLLFLFFPLLSSATDTQLIDDTFQLNEVINYAKPCITNDTYCSSTSICNYTVFYPDNTIYLENVQADNHTSYYNYSMVFTELGIYRIDLVCIDGATNVHDTFYAQITGSGFNETFGFYILLLVLSFGMIIWGLKIRDAPITIFGSFIVVMLALYTLFYGITGIKDTIYSHAVGLILLGFSMYILVRSSYELIKT